MFGVIKYSDVKRFQTFRAKDSWWVKSGGNYAYKSKETGQMIRSSEGGCAYDIFANETPVGIKNIKI